MAENWRAAAACRRADPELFFPVSTTDPERAAPATLEQVAEAKRFCTSCRVAEECLRFAVDHKVNGIWGNTTEEERTAARRQKVMAPE